MSKFTTELRYICEQLAGLDESVGLSKIDEVIDKALPKLFDFDYPIFQEEYRRILERKIVEHYYTREIGHETVGRWQLALRAKMREIMPFYNEMYKKAGQFGSINIFDNINLETDRRVVGDVSEENEKSGNEVENVVGKNKENSSVNVRGDYTETGNNENSKINSERENLDRTVDRENSEEVIKNHNEVIEGDIVSNDKVVKDGANSKTNSVNETTKQVYEGQDNVNDITRESVEKKFTQNNAGNESNIGSSSNVTKGEKTESRDTISSGETSNTKNGGNERSSSVDVKGSVDTEGSTNRNVDSSIEESESSNTGSDRKFVGKVVGSVESNGESDKDISSSNTDTTTSNSSNNSTSKNIDKKVDRRLYSDMPNGAIDFTDEGGFDSGAGGTSGVGAGSTDAIYITNLTKDLGNKESDAEAESNSNNYATSSGIKKDNEKITSNNNEESERDETIDEGQRNWGSSVKSGTSNSNEENTVNSKEVTDKNVVTKDGQKHWGSDIGSSENKSNETGSSSVEEEIRGNTSDTKEKTESINYEGNDATEGSLTRMVDKKFSDDSNKQGDYRESGIISESVEGNKNTTEKKDRSLNGTDTITGNGSDRERVDRGINGSTNEVGEFNKNGESNKTEDGNKNSESENRRNSSKIEQAKGLVKSTESFVETVKGKNGYASYSAMFMEFTKALVNVDMMVIEELAELFFNLWD